MATFDNPLNVVNSATPQTQSFSGSYTPPVSSKSSGGNPFADVLNHVDAWNEAMAGPKDAAIPTINSGDTFGGWSPRSGASASNVPQGGDGNGDTGALPPAINPPTPPTGTNDTRIRPSTPPPVYSDENPPPHPPEGASLTELTNYYRKFAYKNPAFANITEQDVLAYWRDPKGMQIGDWYLAGNRGLPDKNPLDGLGLEKPPAPPTTPDPTTQPDPNGGGYVAPRIEPHYDPNTGIVTYPGMPGYATPAAASPSPPAGAGDPPAAGTPTPPEPPPPAGESGTTPPTPATTTPPPDIQSLIDMFQKEAGSNNGPDIEKMLDPMFARQRQKLDEQLRASAALTPGRLESGGFGMNEGQALSDLSGVQSGKLADALQQQHLAQMQQNTQLIQLGTQAGMQKYVADLNADLTKFQVNTNADLAKWLDNSDNVLKKYGIDKGDVLARYQSELALKGQMYSADKGVDAASLQAAAAHAAASASAAASQANAKLQYDLGMQGLNVDREKNIGQYVLGLLGLGNLDLNSLNGILNGIMPGTVVVKP